MTSQSIPSTRTPPRSRIQAQRRLMIQHNRPLTTRIPETYRRRGRIHHRGHEMTEMEIEPADEMFYVGVRKYGLDATTPRWKQTFFRRVYLPFVRFCFKRLSIPAQGEIHADGSFSWVEHIGIATDRKTAEEMCKGEFYVIHTLPVNSPLPQESLQYKGQVYPKAVKPNRYNRRTFPLTAQPCDHLIALHQEIGKLRKVAGT